MKKLLASFTLTFLFSIGGFSQCSIVNDSAYCGIIPGLVAQSFTANCNGLLSSVEFMATSTGTLSAGTLNIYNSNTPIGSPAYSQNFNSIVISSLNDSVLFNITGTFQIISGNQYTIEFNSGSIPMWSGNSYVGGTAFVDGTPSALDLVFDITVSGPVGVDEHEAKSLMIYPNPTSNQLTISLEEASTGSLRVLNSLGQVILEDEFYNVKELDISIDEPSGLYFLQLEVDDQVITKKILKE